MTWNYRIMVTTKMGQKTYGIHEVYYKADKETPEGWTEQAIAVTGDSHEEVQRALLKMAEACAKPILNAKTGNRVNKKK